MYAAHFGLAERPFSLAPDPRYLFLSEGHREALAHLLYGLEGGGFVQLTGEVGTGKTTVCRALLEQLPSDVDVAMIFTPRLTAVELLATVCDELHVAYPAGTTSLKVLVDALSAALVAAHGRGRRTVLIIDEAQNLSMEVLEELRLLTNIETTRDKLLQVILIGQPELAALMQRPQLRQLAQRITARYHLGPFRFAETWAYVRHRLAVASRPATAPAGRSVMPPKRMTAIFTPAALRVVHRRSGGVPRLINSICDRALLGAFGSNRSRVTAGIARQAAAEVLGRAWARRRRQAMAAVLAVVVVGVVAAAAALGGGRLESLARIWPPRSAVPASDALPGNVVLTPTPARPGPAPPTPPPPPPAAPSPRAGLVDALAAAGGPTDRASAFTALAARWGVDLRTRPGDLACEYARQAGLRCLFRTGTWKVVRRLDLPAILTLVTPSGAKHHVVLVGLDQATATLEVAGRPLTISLAEIEPLWDGAFIALWKLPSVSTVELRPGMSGRDVAWLRQRLAGGESASRGGSAYDAALTERVRAFQQSQGLVPDGIAGEETLVRLTMTGADVPLPSLSARR